MLGTAEASLQVITVGLDIGAFNHEASLHCTAAIYHSGARECRLPIDFTSALHTPHAKCGLASAMQMGFGLFRLHPPLHDPVSFPYIFWTVIACACT